MDWITRIDWTAVAGMMVAATGGVALVLRYWPRPYVSPGRRQLATELLDAVFQVQRHIKTLRSGFFSDQNVIVQQLGEQSRRADELFDQARKELGPKIAPLRKELADCMFDFREATLRLRELNDRTPDSHFNKVWEKYKKIAHGGEDSKYGRKLQSAVHRLEKFLRPYVDSKPTSEEE